MSSLPPPLNISQLDSRLQDVASSLGVPVARARMMLCTLVVSQMLPGAVAIKGGMGVKLRLGERGTRATADLDVSTRARGEEFEGEFRSYLARGGESFLPQRVRFAGIRMRRIGWHSPRRSGLADCTIPGSLAPST